MAGSAAAIAARKSYPDITIAMIQTEEEKLVPCGIPYIFGTLGRIEKNLIPDMQIFEHNIDLFVDQVVSIDPKKKIVKLAEEKEHIHYGKLILATGSSPVVPSFIPGHDLANVFTIKKDADYLRGVLATVQQSQDIVIIGGGFIGVELSDQMKGDGKKVTIIELGRNCLWQSFDPEFCQEAETAMHKKGIQVNRQE